MTLHFYSHGLKCAASFYPPAGAQGPAPCVVMAHGFTGTRDQLSAHAERFAAAGLAVLTFDYRRFGESEGTPRQIVELDEQLDDWRGAIALARRLDSIDATKIALWGCSLAGGHVINLAAEDAHLAAVVAQVPAVDKSARGVLKEARAKMAREGISRSTLIKVMMKSLGACLNDTVRGLFQLPPAYLPVFANPGEAGVFTDRDSAKNLAFFSNAGPTWRNEFAPRFLFATPRYTPGTAERIQLPLLVCVASEDTEADPALAMEIARRAPQGELKVYSAKHFDVYQGAVFEQIVADQIDFLHHHLAVPHQAASAA